MWGCGWGGGGVNACSPPLPPPHPRPQLFRAGGQHRKSPSHTKNRENHLGSATVRLTTLFLLALPTAIFCKKRARLPGLRRGPHWGGGGGGGGRGLTTLPDHRPDACGSFMFSADGPPTFYYHRSTPIGHWRNDRCILSALPLLPYAIHAPLSVGLLIVTTATNTTAGTDDTRRRNVASEAAKSPTR